MKLFTIVFTFWLLNGCTSSINTRENYSAAGFDNSSQPLEYFNEYKYFHTRLSPQEWSMFYKRFPEYWKEAKAIKELLNSESDFMPLYTAYAFKWNTKRRMKKWSQENISRLERKKFTNNDNLFKIIYGMGRPPERVVWNNKYEILAYKTGELAIILKNGKYDSKVKCPDCYVRYDKLIEPFGITDQEVINIIETK